MKILLMVFLLTSFAFAQDQSATPDLSAAQKATAACGPVKVQFDVHEDTTQHPLAQPEPGKALVYFVEDGRMPPCFLCSNNIRVGLDGTWVGATNGNSYFFFSVTPGEHHLCVDLQTKSATLPRVLSLDLFAAEAGKTYYFRAKSEPNTNGESLEPYYYPSWVLELNGTNEDEGQYPVAVSTFSLWHQKK